MSETFEIAGIVIGSVSLIYWLAAAVVLFLAIWLPKIRWQKVAAALATVAAFSYLPAKQTQETYEIVQYRKAAWAHFEKRCKENAGEKIQKTVENVEGIFILKLRSRPTEVQLRDQFWMGDPYGNDGAEASLQIKYYLGDLSEYGGLVVIDTPRKGFGFVEIQEPSQSTNQFVRYSLDRKSRNVVEIKVPDRASIYGVTWDDISTPEDRKYWVAGGKFQVVDLRSNEVIAERIGYVIERGFGAMGGGRTPWLIARSSACPEIKRNVSIDRLFVEKVLKPLGEDAHAK